ncbi:MAG: type II/IV secretion system ATPase subunit [Halobacteria archaeon]
MGRFDNLGSGLLSGFGEGDMYLPDSEPQPSDLVEFSGREGFTEVERYWLDRPYSFVVIISNKDNDLLNYHVVEPELNDFEKRLLERIYSDVRNILISRGLGRGDRDDFLMEGIGQLLPEYGVELTAASFHKMYYYLRRSYIGYGKLEPIMSDEFVEDVSCDGYDIPLYVYHSKYRDIRTNIEFKEGELDSFVTRLAQHSGKHISVEKPIVSTTLKDGSRAELTLGREVARHGSNFTIRKFSEDPFTPIDLIKSGTFSLEQMAYLWLAIENDKSLIFAGGTASGKTTSMNAVSMFIPPRTKVVSIEDTPELELNHENWISSLTREGAGVESDVTMYTLLRSALRHRPEYIIVGEVRGEEAMTLFQAMNTGHTTYSTLHADSVETVVNRLENPPINIPRSMLQALDIISVQVLTRQGDERVRRSKVMSEIAGLDPRTGDINSNELYSWEGTTDEIDKVGKSVVLNDIQEETGATDTEIKKELRNREQVLEYMIEEDIDGYRRFTSMVMDYYTKPEDILDQVGGELVESVMDSDEDE